MIVYFFFACSTTNENILPRSSSQKGAVFELSVTPPDADVLIDGLPWEEGALSRGVHQISIQRIGYKSKQHLISIQDVSRLSLSLELEMDDVPFHFFYPIEDEFILHTREKEINFSGSISTNVPKGEVHISSVDGHRIFESVVNKETFVRRCPQPKEQRASCVMQTKLPFAPMSMIFAYDTLWFTMFSDQQELHALDIHKGTQVQHMEIGGTTRLFSQNDILYLLREQDGLVRTFDVESKELSIVETFSSSWSSAFAIRGTTSVVSSWLKDIVIEKGSAQDRVHRITKPKKIIPTKDNIWILQSEPGGVRSLSGNKSWMDPQASYIQSSLESDEESMWLLEANKKEVLQLSLTTGEKKEFLKVEDATPTDMVVSSKWVVISVHYSGTGLSLGRGELWVYSKKTAQRIDTIRTVSAPNKLVLSKDGLLVVSDISSKALHVYDISVLTEHMDE